VERLLADPRVVLSAALVIDAGVNRGVGPAVVEANEASGARFSGCGPREVLEVLRGATIYSPHDLSAKIATDWPETSFPATRSLR
jgi:hypothetical protein